MKKTICIMGLGYIGLPTAAMFATHGHKIIGVDINPKIVNALNEGKITIKEPYLDIMVQAAVTSGNLVAHTEPQEADVYVIAVPTPITSDKCADMSYVVSATKAITHLLKKGDIVILESTSPTGTVKNIMVPILEESGLQVGEDILLAHSPERVLPGRILIELVENNRIVGGINQKSAIAVRELYRTFVRGDIFLTDATTAEMCKMMENTYRDVNIALSNELALICEKEGINSWEVISLCNKHPRVNLHMPGPGVGGHCIAIDPWFIVEKYPDEANLIYKSRQTNDQMPEYVYNKISTILQDIANEKTITILGITYKADVDDIRESPIQKLVEIISSKRDYRIQIFDPHVKDHSMLEDNIIDACKGSDLLVLGVNHKDFANLDLAAIAKVMRTPNILDTRNFFEKQIDQVNNLGFDYFLLGDGKQKLVNRHAMELEKQKRIV